MNAIDIINIIKYNLKIDVSSNPITEPIMDKYGNVYGERKLGTKLTISLKMGDEVISTTNTNI